MDGWMLNIYFYVIITLTYDTRGKFLTMLPNWNVSAMSDDTPSVIRAGSAFVSIQNAIHEINTDKYVGRYAWEGDEWMSDTHTCRM
jgi:hypothetical protein